MIGEEDLDAQDNLYIFPRSLLTRHFQRPGSSVPDVFSDSGLGNIFGHMPCDFVTGTAYCGGLALTTHNID